MLRNLQQNLFKRAYVNTFNRISVRAFAGSEDDPNKFKKQEGMGKTTNEKT